MTPNTLYHGYTASEVTAFRDVVLTRYGHYDAHVRAWKDAETCAECNRSVSAAQLWPGTTYCKPCYEPIFLDALAQDRAEANGYRALAGRFA